MITAILCIKLMRAASEARARGESAFINRTLRIYPRQAQTEQVPFRFDTAWGRRGIDMGRVWKGFYGVLV